MWANIDTELLNRLPKKAMNGSVRSSTTWADVSSLLKGFQNDYTTDDWDGQGATAIPVEVIESAQALAYALETHGTPAPHWTVPTYESSVTFEWNDPDGSSVEIEVTTPSSVQVVSIAADKNYERWTVTDGVAAP